MYLRHVWKRLLPLVPVHFSLSHMFTIKLRNLSLITRQTGKSRLECMSRKEKIHIIYNSKQACRFQR